MTAKKTKTAKKTPKRDIAKEAAPAKQTAVSRPESPTTWNPFSAMRRLSDEMEQLFRGGATRDIFSLRESAGLWGPDVDVLERKGQLIIRADLPGLSKEDITVDVTDSDLTIAGQRRSEKKEEKEGYYRSERSYGSFRRTIRLPDGVKTDQAKASFKEGVLEVTMPKPSKKKPGRRVTVKT